MALPLRWTLEVWLEFIYAARLYHFRSVQMNHKIFYDKTNILNII